MFKDLIEKSMEVYVDNKLVKSKIVGDHIGHLNQIFNILRKYWIKLNPVKCASGSGKFLGVMVNQRGIEDNPKKINALLQMSSPRNPKEVMSLTGRVATISHFVSRVTDRCAPFFDELKVSKKFK